MACSMKFICILGLILLTGAVVDGQGECGSSSLFSEALKLAQCVPTALTAQCCNLLWSYQQNPECLSAPFFVLTRLESSASRRMLSVPSPNYAFLTSISSVNHKCVREQMMIRRFNTTPKQALHHSLSSCIILYE
ncbi:hypothetical protein Bca101_005140 [Brassica carinata]|uniref:Bifunctional inhibitor/plant lipid transfer protein/seed storage helical domain-containing protein n=1 Tax=Brassica oleracea var. oleracea TaxID=109376 RepID=A0A0D3BE99_BRAOL